MSDAAWKPVCASEWDGLCCAACGDAQTAAVALVDSGALHCFVSETLVAKFDVPVLPGDGMEVMLADRSQVEMSKTFWCPWLCVQHISRLYTVLSNVGFC